MDLSNLKPADGSIKNKKRLGRGEGSGRGGTSTKGHKGAQSRSGYNDLIKILGMGELKAKLDVTAHAFTKSAQEAIEAQGGIATKI